MNISRNFQMENKNPRRIPRPVSYTHLQLTQNVDGVYDALSRFSGLLLSVSGASENLDETLSGVDGTLEQCLDCLLYTSFGAGAQREDHHRSDYRDDTHHVRAGAVGDSAVFGEKEGRGVVRIDLLSSV